MKATIFTDIDGQTNSVDYNSIKELMININEYLTQCYEDSMYDDDILINANGVKFWWSVTAAHYCFAKGRINEVQAFRQMIQYNRNK